MGDAPGGTRFRILFVCTGNLCRSPTAERLARAALGPPFQVSSAGTHAQPGLEMSERAQRVLRRLGGDPEGFASRPLTGELVAGADLVLTAAAVHRTDVVGLHPPAAGLTFTLTEFAALCQEVAAEPPATGPDAAHRARALVERARALRGLVRVERPDIADPMGRSRWAYRAAGREIAVALAVPLRLLTPASAP